MIISVPQIYQSVNFTSTQIGKSAVQISKYMKNLLKLFIGILLFSFIIVSCKEEENKEEVKPDDGTTVTDIEGNVYKIVTIGTQTWMAQNLRTTKYNDGTNIPLVTDNTAWSQLSTPAYCWYDNDATYKTVFGGLYNWQVVETGKLCPTGWHIPSDEEWKTLEMHLGMTSQDADESDLRGTSQGKKLKSTGGWFNDGNGTDDSGFKALGGGFRYSGDGSFHSMKKYGYWWTSTSATEGAWQRYLYYDNDGVYRYDNNKGRACSIRCIKD